MRMLGNYVVFFMFIMGIILAENDGQYQQFYKEMLKLHNEYRAKHRAQSLVWDEKLSEEAMKIAKYVDKKPDPEFSVDIGKNFFFEYLYTEPNARVVFDSWYNQGQYYTNKDDPIMRLETSAFTQIVWRSTKNLGVAVYPGKYNIIIVATYSPPGNDMDDYVMNVVTINDRKDDSSNSWATYSPSGNDMDDYVMNVVTINDRKDDSSSSWGIKKQRTGF